MSVSVVGCVDARRRVPQVDAGLSSEPTHEVIGSLHYVEAIPSNRAVAAIIDNFGLVVDVLVTDGNLEHGKSLDEDVSVLGGQVCSSHDSTSC